MENKLYDVIAIGCGKAGKAFLSWLSRSKTKAAAVDESVFSNAAQGLSPRKALNLENVDEIAGSVVLLRYMRGAYIVYLEDGRMLRAKALAIATGRRLEKAAWSANDVEGKTVVVSGDDDYAMELAQGAIVANCARVIVCGKDMKPRCKQSKLNKLLKTGKAEFLPNCRISGVEEAYDGTRFVKTSTMTKIRADSLLFADEAKPRTEFLPKSLAEIDGDGYILTQELQHSKLPGIFYVGYCRKDCTSAYSDGKNAAIKAEALLHGGQAV